MERHPNRESVIGLYPRDHPGTDKLRISENPSTLVIVFCIDDERGRLQHRLDVRHEVIADHGAEEFENILDTQRVIERLRKAGTESVVASTDGGTGRACSGLLNSGTKTHTMCPARSPFLHLETN